MEIIKFFHYFGLMLGAGAMFGNLGVAIIHKRLGGGPPPDAFKMLKPLFGRFGLVGITLLWITGALMSFDIGAGILVPLFYLKLILAAAVFSISLWLFLQGLKAKKNGVPPPAYMDNLGRFSGLITLIVIGIAVVLFS